LGEQGLAELQNLQNRGLREKLVLLGYANAEDLNHEFSEDTRIIPTSKPARMPSRTGRKLSECLNGIDVEKGFLLSGEAAPHS
jgi:hypothetical protein